MWMKVHKNNAKDERKAAVHIVLFHLNTLSPSNIPKGIRLMKAIKALKNPLSTAIRKR